MLRKISKRWGEIKFEISNIRGFWSQKASNKTILKISKREDYYRRRIFLKVMRNSENKEYLSFEKYQTQLELGRRLTLKQAYSSDSPINKSSSSSISFKRSQGLTF